MTNESSQRALSEILAEVRKRREVSATDTYIVDATRSGTVIGNTSSCNDEYCGHGSGNVQACDDQPCSDPGSPPDTSGNTYACGDYVCLAPYKPGPPAPGTTSGNAQACNDWCC